MNTCVVLLTVFLVINGAAQAGDTELTDYQRYRMAKSGALAPPIVLVPDMRIKAELVGIRSEVRTNDQLLDDIELSIAQAMSVRLREATEFEDLRIIVVSIDKASQLMRQIDLSEMSVKQSERLERARLTSQSIRDRFHARFKEINDKRKGRSEVRAWFWKERKDPLQDIRNWVNWFYKLDLNTVERLYEIEYLLDEIETIHHKIDRAAKKQLTRDQREELETLRTKINSRKDMIEGTLEKIVERGRSELRTKVSA